MFSPCSPAVLSTQRFRESIAREISSSLLLIKAKSFEYQLRYGYSYREKDKRSKNIKTDPIELTDKYLKIELELERLIRKEIGEGGYMGFCHKYWWTKKNLLKDKYGIEWKSPVDMNPDVDFD